MPRIEDNLQLYIVDLNNNLSYQNFIKKYNNDISDSSYESDSSED